MHVIYGLFDPRDETQVVRYIGFSSKCVERRLVEHISESRAKVTCHRHKWIRKLLSENIRPGILIIENVIDENWQERERYWINFYKDNNLVNCTSGGDGLINPSKDVLNRIRKTCAEKSKGNQYRKGILHSPEDRKKISDGVRNSEKYKAAMALRRGKPGRAISDQEKMKISAANKGKKRQWTQDWLDKINQSKIGRKWINNGLICKHLFPGEILPKGWSFGRICNAKN